MFNGSSAPFFLLFFAVVLICFLQCMVVAAVTICLFPARFADLFVRGPFVMGFELLSFSLMLPLSDDARNNVAMSSVAVSNSG